MGAKYPNVGTLKGYFVDTDSVRLPRGRVGLFAGFTDGEGRPDRTVSSRLVAGADSIGELRDRHPECFREAVSADVGASSQGQDAYYVVEFTPGYMPEDDDPVTFANERDARVYASDCLSRLLDHLCDDGGDWAENYAALSVSGSFQSDWSVLVTDARREHDLGRIIEIGATWDQS